MYHRDEAQVYTNYAYDITIPVTIHFDETVLYIITCI